jgi:hypothetical protein
MREQKLFAAKIKAKEPLLNHRWGFIDGKNYNVQEPGGLDLQNAMYNGWLHSTKVTNTICFGADGKYCPILNELGCIAWIKYNCPGSWNDSEMSRGFFEKLLDVRFCPDQRYGVLSDSAFPVSDGLEGRIMTPLKENDLVKIAPRLWKAALKMSNSICAIRQAAEWGMGAPSKVYRRLDLKLPFNVELRSLRLGNIFRLLNYRTRRTGISQIRTFFFG